MSMEIRKIAAAGLFGLAAYAMTGTASAQTTTCNAASSGTWDCVVYQNGSSTYVNAPADTWFGPSGDDTTSFHFEGDSDLSYLGIFSASCTLEIEGQLRYREADDEIDIRVTDADAVAGASLCNSIYLEGFPWTATIDGADDVHPAAGTEVSGGNTSGTLSGIVISLFSPGSGTCTGSLSNVIFANGDPISDPSLFDFNGSVGSCTVDGTVYSDSNYDVNAY